MDLAADGIGDYWRLSFLFLLLAVVVAALLLGYAVWALRSGRRIRRRLTGDVNQGRAARRGR